jgi:TolB-like protein
MLAILAPSGQVISNRRDEVASSESGAVGLVLSRSCRSAAVGSRLALAAAILLSAFPAAGAPADQRPKVAVMDFQPSGASASLAGAATGAVSSELDRLQVFKVVTSEAIRGMLALERQKQMLGCPADSSACLAEIGGALGVDYLVSGRVIGLGGGTGAAMTYTLELTLSNVKKASRDGSALEKAGSEAALIGLVPRAVGKLTSRLLASRTGKLMVTASETGAVVKVDDQARGTTPLPGPLEVPSGPRALSVEKQGFVAWQTDVVIQPGKMTAEAVTLMPSPDFIEAYESRSRRMRIGAWTATGVALAGVATTVVMQLRANSLYGNSSTPGTFLYYRQKVTDGAVAPPGGDFRADVNRLGGQVTTAENLSYVGAGVAAVSGGIALWLWLAGDDPSRYVRYHKTSLLISPVPGGAALALSGGF